MRYTLIFESHKSADIHRDASLDLLRCRNQLFGVVSCVAMSRTFVHNMDLVETPLNRPVSTLHGCRPDGLLSKHGARGCPQ